MLQELTRLQQQRRSWEEFLQVMPDAALYIDDQGRVQALNDRFQSLSGRMRESLYDTPLDEIIVLDPRALFSHQGFFSLLSQSPAPADEFSAAQEFLLSPNQGPEIPVLLSIQSIQGHATLSSGHVITVRDIRSLRGAQQRLYDEKQRYESLFNSISDAVYLAPLSEDGVHGNFVEINDEACRRLGYSRNELMKMNARSLNPNYNLEKVRALGRRIRRDKQVQFEAIHTARDGQQIPVGVTANLVNIANQDYVLSVSRDLREEKQRQKAEERFGRLLDHSWDEIFIFEADSLKLVQVNDGAIDNLGYSHEDTLGHRYDEFLADMSQDELSAALEPLNMGEDGVIIFEAVQRRKDGSEYPVEVRAQISHNEVPAVYMVNAHDITERKRSEERLHFLANYDTLTSLPNRSLMMDRLSQAVENAKRTKGTCALIFMDLDGFKNINDSLGHDAGDTLLKVVAIRLQESLRKSDTIARLGGDEFTILLQNLHSTRDVDRVAEKLISTVAEPVTIHGEQVQVTTSLGVVLFPTNNDDVDSLLRKSDSAMYVAKKSGKNQWCLYQETQQPES